MKGPVLPLAGLAHSHSASSMTEPRSNHEDVVSIGGMLFIDGRVEAFGCIVPELLCASWKSRPDQTQVIGQAEVFPFLVAKLTWKEYLEGRNVLFFIDNGAARLGLVKAYSPSLPSLTLVMQCCQVDYEVGMQSWYARVPTKANPSDSASRLDSSLAETFYSAKLVQPVFPSGFSPLESLKNSY